MNSFLSKSLSQIHVLSLAFGAIIGFGCFVLPTDMMLPSAGPLGSFLGISIGAFFVTIIAYCLSFLINKFPKAGGIFYYSTSVFNKTYGFICGWALLISYISLVCINIAAIPVITRLFLSEYKFIELYSIYGWTVYVSDVLLMILVSLFFCFINYKGIKIAGIIQSVFAILLVVSAVVIFIASLFYNNTTINNIYPLFSDTNGVIGSILIILSISPFLFVGFDTIPQVAEEFTFSPAKSFKIMLISIFAGACIYIIVMFSVAMPFKYLDIVALMKSDILDGGSGWGTAYIVDKTIGVVGKIFLMFAVFSAVFSGINGFYIASSRLILALSRGNLVPSLFGKISEKTHTPINAILFVFILSLLTPFAGRSVIAWTVEMSSVGTVIGYIFACFCAYKMFSMKNNIKIIFIFGICLSCICLLLLIVPYSPAKISNQAYIILLLWILLGFIFYLFKNKINKSIN